ncbi:hypothetical protein [Mesorhizobium sp. M1252]|uniref:hypothetical protein n=1 Tax=Mesorhizobium sp. M1252 TaxID=2957073 RepID=UPI00333BB7AB
MEPLEKRFATSAEFMRWAKLAVKLPRYDRVPVGNQVWTYGDGHQVETKLGKRGGTLNANLRFLLKTGIGDLEHSSDARLVSDIDSRGGAVLRVSWGDE